MRQVALALALPVVAAACVGHRAPPAYAPKGQTKCSIAASQMRPLVVEWPSADRLDLEAQARKGIVVVRYAGCELEVLRGCTVAGAYGYSPATRQDDRVHIRDEDELYANIPIHAVNFEASLRSAGELTVAMSMVGRYEAPGAKVAAADLQGDCGKATHAIVALTAGAFEFYTGAEEGSSTGVGVAATGAGMSSGREHTTLNRAGRADACDRATAFLELTDPGNMNQDNATPVIYKLAAAIAGFVGVVTSSSVIAFVITTLDQAIRQLRKGYSRVLEVESSNQEIINQTGVNDFIISNRLISMIFAQLSEEPRLKTVYDTLFAEAGSEIYVKPASLYFPSLPLTCRFVDLMGAAQARGGEICIGYKLLALQKNAQENYGVRLVPDKNSQITLTENDALVVVAVNEL